MALVTTRAGAQRKPPTGMEAVLQPQKLLANLRRTNKEWGLGPEDEASNLRVWQMYDELVAFRTELTELKDCLAEFEGATSDFLGDLAPLMRAPVPRVWDKVEGGLLAEPVRTTISHDHPHMVGGLGPWDALREARDAYCRRTRSDILQPLELWLESLRTAEGRLPELESLQMDLGRRTRRVTRQEEELDTGHHSHRDQQDRPRGKRGNALVRAITCGAAGKGPSDVYEADEYLVEEEEGGGGDGDAALQQRSLEEKRAMALSHKQRQLEAARASYVETERLLYDQMAGLARDAAWLKSYLASALLLTKEAMQVAVVGLGPTKQPLPSFGAGAGVVAERRLKDHGAVVDNVDLAAEWPPTIEITRREHEEGPSSAELVAGRARAHRATAQPMELAARDDLEPAQPVAPMVRGAAELPVDALEGWEANGAAAAQ